ncbi:hypothetical protein [Marivirga sp.]|uniref:hypothetical protein n=1 Tax=Marivirga sp. TaxID=2018662 RepID=UPI003DA773A5
MKKYLKVLPMVLMLLVASLFGANFAVSQELEGGGGGESCTTEILDCPRWGTGDRVICHENGGGINCNCGESTECGGD